LDLKKRKQKLVVALMLIWFGIKKESNYENKTSINRRSYG